MQENSKYARFSEFFRNSEKSENNLKLGAEFEHFIVDGKTFRSISYEQKKGIHFILRQMVKNYDWQPRFSGKHVVGLSGKDAHISLEPAGQFEISIEPQKCIFKIESIYLRIVQEVNSILEKLGYELVTFAYHPRSKIEELQLLPKSRYYKMYDYFKDTGKLAHNMMKGTAAIQVAIDYTSEKDFTDKMRLAYRLSPLIALLFDNSIFFEGEPYRKNILRQLIWRACDDKRCGYIPGLFKDDFGYQKYAEYILNVPPIFILDSNDQIVDWKRPLKEIYQEDWTEEQFKHAFSMHFPEIRARNYIEIRTSDALPYPLNIVLLHFIRNIFYNKKVFLYCHNLLRGIEEKEIEEAIQDIHQNGFEASYGGEPVAFYLNSMSKIMRSELSTTRLRKLDIVFELIAKNQSYKQYILANFDNYRLLLERLTMSNLLRCSLCAHQ